MISSSRGRICHVDLSTARVPVSRDGSMFHLAIFGGNKIDGSTVDPGEQVVGLALFGGIEFDFTQCPAPEGAELMIFAIFGGATVKVREDEDVMFSGVSLFGGRSMEPKRERSSRESDGDRFPFPLEVAAYSIFGGVSVKRG
jgi:hypothetical protein